jgi:hypothetical protein
MTRAPSSGRIARTGISWRILSRPAAIVAVAGGLLFGFLSVPAGAAATASSATTGVSGSYIPVTPTRIADTRSASGFPDAGQTIGSGGTLDVQVSGSGGVPTGAAVAVLNVTAINPSQPGFLSVNPEGQNQPASVSNLNFVTGQITANLVTVPLSSSGAVGIFNHVGNADVAVDVQGYYGSTPATDGSGLFNTLSPSRVLGTLQSGSPIGPNTAVSVPVAADTGVPADATAVVVNLTAAGGTDASFLSAYGTGTSQPTVSNLDFVAGQTVANRATVPMGTNGDIEVYNHTGTVNVDVDVNGYYTGAGGTGSAFVPITPQRLVDTRTSTGGTSIAPATNVTAIPGNAPGYLTVYPTADTTVPVASDVDWAANEVVPNFTIADTAGTGNVNMFNNQGATLDLAIDAFGYFAPVTPPVMGLTITATPSSVAPSGTASVVTTVTSNGVPQGDVPIQVIVSSPTVAACSFNNDLNPSVGNTDSNGTFTSTYTAPAATGSESTCQVTANIPGGMSVSTTITNLAS